jgi:hypothetical protein
MPESQHVAVLGGDGMEDMEAPGLVEVEESVRALDGYDRTIVVLSRGPAHMAVGGDAAKGLVLYADLGEEDFRNLTAPGAGDESVEVIAGGQPGNHRARYVVSKAQALAAMKAFWQDGRLDPDQVWEIQ